MYIYISSYAEFGESALQCFPPSGGYSQPNCVENWHNRGFPTQPIHSDCVNKRREGRLRDFMHMQWHMNVYLQLEPLFDAVKWSQTTMTLEVEVQRQQGKHQSFHQI